MSKSITFKQLAKWIHPDTNPNVQNSSEKMTEAMRYMDDEQALYRLAIKWGFVDDDLTKFDIKYKMNEGKHLLSDNQSCIVVDSYWENNKYVVVIWNKDKAKFQKFYRTDEYDQNEDFYVNGIYMEDDYVNIDYNYQMMKWKRGGI